jgi:polyisoprenoid-binding protein YceI
MATYDANTAQCWVFSYKEGLLSKIAHDLKHRVTRFTIHVDPQRNEIAAEIDARSLRVECVMKDGKENTTELTGDDKAEIEDQIMMDVLHADVHPLIRFQSTAVVERPEGLQIEGNIVLNDRTQPIATLARRQQDHYVAELTIHQPAFGIKPFSAMLGALKIKPDVVVRVLVPAT